MEKNVKEYTMEIFDILIEIYNVEGLQSAVRIPNPNYKNARFKPYPYKDSLREKLMADGYSKHDAVLETIQTRIFKHLQDSIIIEEESDDH